jgi:hypothetical protein
MGNKYFVGESNIDSISIHKYIIIYDRYWRGCSNNLYQKIIRSFHLKELQGTALVCEQKKLHHSPLVFDGADC